MSMDYTLERFETETDIDSYIEDYVDIEHFLECCKACPNYANRWACPPYDFDPMDIWKAYDRLLIAGYRLTFSEDRTEEEMTKALWEVKQKLSEELYAEEKKQPGSRSLSAGTCQLCRECSKPEGKPCRYPDQMRYSIESIGGNVGRTISKLCGIEIEWIEEGRLPEHFVLVGGLLKGCRK